MFRRRWSSLPKDASFPSSLKGLGYFINDADEVRSIEKPDCYFKYFANHNMRVNERQRFAFNRALEKIVHERLEEEGLAKMTLPRGASPSEKHAPIFTTPDIESSPRVIVIFGEPTTDLGILSYRIANGPGGLDRGSMVNAVRTIAKHAASTDDSNSPGIVLANMGQRYWWPEGKRALTISASGDTPLPSLVHSGTQYVPSLNAIAGSETPLQHMETIFSEVLEKLPNRKAKIDVIAIGESCEVVQTFFDNKTHWDSWSDRLNGMVLFGTVFGTEMLMNDSFREFLAQRTRGYLLSEDPLDTPLAPPSGNPSLAIEALGCPCYSSSEPLNTEVIAVRALDPALSFLQDVSMTPGFVNSPITVVERPRADFRPDEWDSVAEENKPPVHTVDNEAMLQQVKQLRRWRKFEQTGEAPDSESSDDEDKDVPLGDDAWV
ncbi:Arb2 domain-containing protein [Thelonectria olida]|uniref:Arb2 domain-containing protein n=1 Tax=Thelonectria olida TaxID=1576542 RepID=A0A9P9AMQ8_9HYPO|nr:Arb2 domain-containing protein [Thelonectria olida]